MIMFQGIKISLCFVFHELPLKAAVCFCSLWQRAAVGNKNTLMCSSLSHLSPGNAATLTQQQLGENVHLEHISE